MKVDPHTTCVKALGVSTTTPPETVVALRVDHLDDRRPAVFSLNLVNVLLIQKDPGSYAVGWEDLEADCNIPFH